MTRKQNSQALQEIAGQLTRSQHFLGELKPANAYRNVRKKLPWLTREDFALRFKLLAAAYATALAELPKHQRPPQGDYRQFEDIDTSSLLQFLKRSYPTVPKRVMARMLGMIVYLGYLR